MALVKQNVYLPFSQGIDTKIDKKQVVPGRLQVLENAVFTSVGEIQKRNGYSVLTKNVLDEDDFSNPRAIASFKDELLALTDSALYSYSPTSDRWVNKGRISKVFPESTPILRNIYTQSNVDALCKEGLNVYVWEDSRGGIRYTVTDSANNSSFLVDAEVTASGETPKLAAIGALIYIFYVDGTDLKYRRINPVDPNTLESEVVAVNDVDGTNSNYDVQGIQNEIYVAYESSVSGGQLQYFSIDVTGALSSVIAKAGESASACVTMDTDDASRVIIGWSDGTDVKYNIYAFDFNVEILAPTTVETISNVNNITISENTTDNYDIIYEVTAASDKDYLVKRNTADVGGTVGTAGVILRSVGLQSNAFRINNVNYFLALHSSQFQSTLFLVDSSGNVVAKVSAGLAGNHRKASTLAEVSDVGDSKFLIGSQVASKIISEDNEFFTSLGVQSTLFDFDSITNYQKASMANNLHISGGYLQSYDGQTVSEQGFHLYPEDLSNTANAASGGGLADGDYDYIAVYSWNDNQGQRHFSSPSLSVTATASAGGTAQTLTIRVPTLRITDKENVMIDLYRTELNGTIFYRVTSVTSPEINDPTVDTIDIVDGVSDADLISNELLYTTGGILENIAPGSASLITTFSNRTMIIPSESPNILQYSKINSPGVPLEFSDLLQVPIGKDEEPVTAIATLDDKFILFKKTRMFFIGGEGPNNAGQQNTFTEPEIISEEVGCDEPDSIILTPGGLMFKSNKGIYLLSRGLQVSYIGSPVEAFNSERITSAEMIPDTTQIRFTISDKDCLVYDYLVNQWSTFTNHGGEDALILNAEYYYLNTAGLIYKETPGEYVDGGTDISMALETSWLSFTDFAGFQRVYRMIVTGEYKSAHRIKVRVAYNFIEAFTQEKIIDTADFTSDDRYGDVSNYGDETPYGGDGNQYQFRVDMKKQKCESIRIRIEEIQESSSIGEGLSLSALTFKVGTKSGLYKVDDNQKFGTNT